MPLPESPPVRVQAPKWAGVGIEIPPRQADCSGVRPSWYPFQINVCDSCCDAPDPEPYSGRDLALPPPPVVEPPPVDSVALGDWVLRPQLTADAPFYDGDLRLNSAIAQSVTLLWIKHMDSFGVDRTAEVATLALGMGVRIIWPQGETPIAEFTQYDYTVLAPPIDHGTYSEISVAIESFVTGETRPADWNHYGQDHTVKAVL